MTAPRKPSAARRRVRSRRRGDKQGPSVAERQLALLNARPVRDFGDCVGLPCGTCGEMLCGCSDAAWMAT